MGYSRGDVEKIVLLVMKHKGNAGRPYFKMWHKLHNTHLFKKGKSRFLVGLKLSRFPQRTFRTVDQTVFNANYLNQFCNLLIIRVGQILKIYRYIFEVPFLKSNPPNDSANIKK